MLNRALGYYARTGWRGFDRMCQALGYGHNKPIRVKTNAGTWMYLDPHSYIDRHVLKEGYYESEVLDAIKLGLRSGSVLWDIGANIGLHSIAVKSSHPDCVVMSFEPSPAVLGSLWQNASINQADISICSFALSDAEAFATLYIAKSGNPGMTTLAIYPGLEDAYQTEVVVATIQGDTLVERGLSPRPNVVKIDVEGHELKVLSGMRQALAHADCRRVIFEDGTGPSDVKALLADLGFSVEILSRNEDTAHLLHNFIATKPER